MADENETKIRDAAGPDGTDSPAKSPVDVRDPSHPGLLSQLTAEQKALIYAYDGDISQGDEAMKRRPLADGDLVAKRSARTIVGRIYDLYEENGVQMAEVLWPVPNGAEYVPVAQLVRHAD